MADIATVTTPLGGSASRLNSVQKSGFLRRILLAIMESRRRKAEIEIAEFIRRRGGTPPQHP